MRSYASAKRQRVEGEGQPKATHRCSGCGCEGFPTMINQPAGFPVLRIAWGESGPALLCPRCRPATLAAN